MVNLSHLYSSRKKWNKEKMMTVALYELNFRHNLNTGQMCKTSRDIKQVWRVYINPSPLRHALNYEEAWIKEYIYNTNNQNMFLLMVFEYQCLQFLEHAVNTMSFCWFIQFKIEKRRCGMVVKVTNYPPNFSNKWM